MTIVLSRVRTDDPQTSHQGAADVATRAPSQAMKLLVQYARSNRSLTAEEAADLAGVNRPGVCYWKRCSELREMGYIAPVRIAGVLVTRTSAAGSAQMVCVITDAGREALRAKGLL